MIPLPDGTLRYSPTDLVAYLEDDFAACHLVQYEEGSVSSAYN